MYAIMAESKIQLIAVDTPADADIFIDDIIDSGVTMQKYCDKYPSKPFFALIDKTAGEFSEDWVVFPWEGDADGGIEDNIRRLLQFIGEDASRGGLTETPKRVAKAWQHWCSGYGKQPSDILKCFEDGADGCDEMIIVKNIPFYTHCEHHLAPFFGTATVTYVPNGKIVGLSKISRIVDIFARRLQVQERLTNQIADALWNGLSPKGVGVIITARHLCMESRGICQQGHQTITSALRGVLKDKPEARAEFMALATK
jgi:GTP cyclohydrolase I